MVGTDVPAGWVTTSEAAARLGVKRATLYAYVSRGVLRSRRRAGQQESLFERAQVDALAGHTRQPGTPQPLLRFRSVATSVSGHRDGDLFYRGVPVEQICAELSVEEAAALVLGARPVGGGPSGAASSGAGQRPGGRHPPAVGPSSAASSRELPAGVLAALAGVPVERRVPLAVALLGAGDPLRDDRDPVRVRHAVIELLGDVLPLLDGSAGTTATRQAQGLAGRLFQALVGRRPAARERECLSALVIALMDHGLTAS
ncbi:MAG TPA: citrate synthase, partial [Segeticoccus sp.]|nr:citrate synthase [Segeticoccus sp.]